MCRLKSTGIFLKGCIRPKFGIGIICAVPRAATAHGVELIVIHAQSGRLRVAAALSELEEQKNDLGASEFCLRLEKAVRGKVKW